jgi:O-acetyl-ADP-ribose deacetylase (regulator of RNase III)
MAEVSRKINATKISLMRGDITRQAVDAIVNAANSGLLGGGGVDGAIHRAGGPAILAECKQIRDVQGPCAPGGAVITGGGNLAAKHVIHAVGPIWRGGTTNEADILASAYRTSLALAQAFELKTVAFPSISTGAYGYPVDLAAAVAIKTVSEFCQIDDSLEEVRFVLFDEFTFNAYADALNQLAGTTI